MGILRNERDEKVSASRLLIIEGQEETHTRSRKLGNRGTERKTATNSKKAKTRRGDSP